MHTANVVIACMGLETHIDKEPYSPLGISIVLQKSCLGVLILEIETLE